MRGLSRAAAICAILSVAGCQSAGEYTYAGSSSMESLFGRLFGTTDQPKDQPAPNDPTYGESPLLSAAASAGTQKDEPQQVSGKVSPEAVVDGDTIKLAGRRIRLHGIDAPERDQACTIGGRQIPCGVVARSALIGFVLGADVRCERKDVDRYGRDVSVCLADGANVSALMVRSGMAVAYRKYSSDYVAEEEEARQGKRGMWAGSFEMPWEWRARKRK